MYSREYDGLELNFEPSGGLVNSSLVMQDKQTDSYWSIMTGGSTAGRFKGTQLVEMPVTERVQWKQWRERHPETLVLSIRGSESDDDGYGDYWTSPVGFNGQRATDKRLQTKAPIYAFEYGGSKYAVPHTNFAGGHVFALGDGTHLFLYREPGAALFSGTDAYSSATGFHRDGETWVESATDARFDAATGTFSSAQLTPFSGFDTFWYNWSLNNPGTKVLE